MKKTTILVFGAHPDDIEFGCAPLLIKEIKKGNTVHLLVLSRGEAGTNGTSEEREQESRKAAELIGASINFLDMGGDCRMEQNFANTVTIAEQIRTHKPSIIIAPTIQENQHPDHAKVGKMSRDAARFARYGGLEELTAHEPHAVDSLYYYAISPKLGTPDIIIDVSEEKELWEQAMQCHETQLQARRYIEMQLARSRHLGATIGVDYALGLYTNDPIHLHHISDVELSSRHY